jgi:anti-sigma factor RsiW
VAMSRTITCSDAAASLNDYCDGRLPPGRRQSVVTHLRGCGECAQAVKDIRCTRRLLRRLLREPMPDAMKQDLIHELRRSRTSPAPAPHAHQSGPSHLPDTSPRPPQPQSDSGSP